MAKRGLDKIREQLMGKTMLKNKEDSNMRIAKDRNCKREEEEELKIGDLLDGEEEVSMEIEKEDMGKLKEDKKSGTGQGKRQGDMRKMMRK